MPYGHPSFDGSSTIDRMSGLPDRNHNGLPPNIPISLQGTEFPESQLVKVAGEHAAFLLDEKHSSESQTGEAHWNSSPGMVEFEMLKV